MSKVFSEGKLVKELVVAKFARTTKYGAMEGNSHIKQIEYYNLDAFDCVGYRLKSKQRVPFQIMSKAIPEQTSLDIRKANEQYGGFTSRVFTKSHDRLLIIDDADVYHLGASLKDLGKKWFAFSKMDKGSVGNILQAIGNNPSPHQGNRKTHSADHE